MTQPRASSSNHVVLDREVVDANAQTTTLRVLADGRPLLVYFMRTRSCPPCRAHVRQIAREYGRLEAAGLAAAVVVPGDGPEAARLQTGLEIPFPAVADPLLDAYRGAGLSRSMGIQRSGAIVFEPGGREIFAYRKLAPFGPPDLQAIVASVRKLHE
jgi:peroxiredoxin